MTADPSVLHAGTREDQVQQIAEVIDQAFGASYTESIDAARAVLGLIEAGYVSVNGGGNCSVAAARDAMGIDWMTKGELNLAIPPAMTEYLGKQLLEQL